MWSNLTRHSCKIWLYVKLCCGSYASARLAKSGAVSI
jgi:hypothetical protein